MGREAIAPITPFASWPEGDRRAWESGAPDWTSERARAVQREYGRLLAWLAQTGRPDAPLGEDVLFAYATWLKARSIERPGLDRLSALVHALLVLRPESGVTGLQRALAEWRRDHPERQRGRPACSGNRKPCRARHSLRYLDWPQSERARWEAATRTGGKYSGGGPLSGYRPSTVQAYREAYALWLGFLHRTGHSPAPVPEAVDAFAADLERRISADGAAKVLRRVRRVLAALQPGVDDTRLRHHARRLAGRHRVAESKLPRLVHPGQLVAAGERLIAAARGALRTRRAALDYRDGLLLVLLAHRPVRIANMAAVRRGIELDLETPQGRLSWTPAQTKNKVALSLALTPELVALIREYWEAFRWLHRSEASGMHLWLGQDGRPLTTFGLRGIVTRRTGQLLGKRVPPHLFRDCLATMIATERPERIDDVQALLGQRAPRSKDTYIALARSIIAQKHRQALEEAARQATGRKRLRFRTPLGTS